MNDLLLNSSAAQAIRRGTVSRVENDAIVVGFDGSNDELVCDVLVTAGGAHLAVAAGDSVLVWQPDPNASGVVLGRIGPSRVDVPAEIVLEAKENLTLRVGDGSITIRADGKILIKGKDLVSHAKNLNRIKGGAVAIN